MKKETVDKFDLEAAFKALDEIEIPVAEKGIRANRVNLKERFSHKSAHEALVEDYYDINSTESLEEAQEDREGEVAQAKLARIEKIVDLDAESPEDLLPSYVGKVIMQCPQCMTLFYKNPEDIEHSEENPDVVNINEICQHCGNSSGYTLIGKVDSVNPDEADKYDMSAAEPKNELDLDFPEEGTEEVDAEGTGEAADEMGGEELDLDLSLEEIPEEEEKKEESFDAGSGESLNETYVGCIRSADVDYVDVDSKPRHAAIFAGELNEDELTDLLRERGMTDIVINFIGDEPRSITQPGRKYEVGDVIMALEESVNDSEAQKEAEKGSELKTEHESENLTLNEQSLSPAEANKFNFVVGGEGLTEAVDKDLDKKLAEHNEYIEYLKNSINEKDEALKKAENEEIKAALQRCLDALNADLEAALPDALKGAAEPVAEVPEVVETEETAVEEEPKEDEVAAEETAVEESTVEEALTDVAEGAGKCKVVFADDKSHVVFVGTKEDCDRIVEKNKNTNTAKKHGLEVVCDADKAEPAKDAELAQESLNASEAQTDAEKHSELATENGSENLTLNESLKEDLTDAQEDALDALLDSEEFKTPISDKEVKGYFKEDAEEAAKLSADLDNILDSWLEDDGSVAQNASVADDDASVVDDDASLDAKGDTPKEEETDELLKDITDVTATWLDKDIKEGVFDKIKDAKDAKTLSKKFNVFKARVYTADGDVDEARSVKYDKLAKADAYAKAWANKSDNGIAEVVGCGDGDECAVLRVWKWDDGKKKAILSDNFLAQNAAAKKQADKDAKQGAKIDKLAAKGVKDESLGEAAPEADFELTDVEELDEASFNEHVNAFLKEVYSNVESFEAESCHAKDDKIVVEGVIKFNSGKSKPTTFEFRKAGGNGSALLEGANDGLAEGKAFKLSCRFDEGSKTLFTESIGYSYKINDVLVEGLK